MIQTIKTKYQKKRQKNTSMPMKLEMDGQGSGNGWAGRILFFQFTASSKMKAAQYLGDA